MPELPDVDCSTVPSHSIDARIARLFKHPHLGVNGTYDVRRSDPLFYPAKPLPTGSR